MKIMSDFFRSIDWWKMVPDQTIFKKCDNGNIGARSLDGDWIVVYLTDKAPETINLGCITSSSQATGWWINPLTAERTRIDLYPTASSATFTMPSDWQDAVLFLKGDNDSKRP
jgi:hypothetical protein